MTAAFIDSNDFGYTRHKKMLYDQRIFVFNRDVSSLEDQNSDENSDETQIL